MNIVVALILALSIVLLTACGSSFHSSYYPSSETPPLNAMRVVDNAAIIHDSGSNWLSYGRTYDEQRYSPLDQINESNLKQLGVAWSYPMPGAKSMVGTPLVVDGVMYFSTDFSVVYAIDAKTGQELWRYDPRVKEVAGKAMAALPNSKGIAFWKGKVYVGTMDGRLIAIDASNGEEIWAVQTRDSDTARNINGAPRVFNGKVIIGHGGADYHAIRAYVTAYDAETGEQAWRWYTVPGNPADGFENKAMEMAAKTWNGEWWKLGGGGTAWNSMTYDPKYNRILIGTGNGGPWNRSIRSPGGGDNLFLCSVVALDADTGEYIWHYQTTPGEEWDYNSTMDMTLAEIDVGGKPTEVILHAPKNGFFYVLNRETGKLISAEKFGKVTWAERIDLETGRPVEHPKARYSETSEEFLLYPSTSGAHNWQPQSYNPNTGLVYFPYTEKSSTVSSNGISTEILYRKDFSLKAGIALIPSKNKTKNKKKSKSKKLPHGELVAWDPVKQKAAWRKKLSTPYNGGTLTTAGNLVVQGTGAGILSIYAADTGEELWSFDTGWGISAAPISYSIDGEQYLAIGVGWGSLISRASHKPGLEAPWQYGTGTPTMLAFKLNGTAPTPVIGRRTEQVVPFDEPSIEIDISLVQQGMEEWVSSCGLCHGMAVVSGGGTPDLRASPMAAYLPSLMAVLRDGALESRGMPRFDHLSDKQIKSLHSLIRYVARRDLKANKK